MLRLFLPSSLLVGIQYSSTNPNGLVGMGWDLSVPYIERMTNWGLPQYDASDRFELQDRAADEPARVAALLAVLRGIRASVANDPLRPTGP